MKRILSFFLLAALFFSVISSASFLSSALAGDEAGASPQGPPLSLKVKSPVSFTNAVFHYVFFDADFSGAVKLLLKVKSPGGRYAAFQTYDHIRKGSDPGTTWLLSVRRTDTLKENLSVLFNSGCAAGVWTIEVKATDDRGNSTLASFPVEVQAAPKVVASDYETVRPLLIGLTSNQRTVPVEKGKVRYISQDDEDVHFVPAYWTGDYDLKENSSGMCSRAVFSMALSWLGVDCTPEDISELMHSTYVDAPYDNVLERIGGLARVEGSLDELWDNYVNKGYSPLYVHFTFGSSMHTLLLIAKDSVLPDLYYAVSSGMRANTAANENGLVHDHILPVLLQDTGVNLKLLSPFLLRYDRATVDTLCQWKVVTEDGS